MSLKYNMKNILIFVFSSFTLIFGNDALDNADKKCELKNTIGSKNFPDDFVFGVSTAAYQIEGGWNEDGKGPSVWDTFTHDHPEMMDDKSNGDIAADSYHHFDQDLAALKELKVQYYRFSISWSRILPNGDISSKNQKGIDYYNMMIDKLLSNNIQPMVTMFHYDMPEELSKFGGFTNSLIIDYFKYYADTLFENFGDRVKIWTTINEPFDFCNSGYGNANYPPMVHSPGILDYICMDILLKAHATAYHLYKEKYFDEQQGKIGITLSTRFYYSKVNDTQLVYRGMQYALGWLAHPIFSSAGNYPQEMLVDIAKNSLEEGRAWSRLKELDSMWMEKIKGAGDFLGINYYTSSYIEPAIPPLGETPSWEHDEAVQFPRDAAWKRGKSSWLYCVPEGLEELLKWIRQEYNNIEVFVTENGWSDDGQLDDNERIDYLQCHLQAVLNAVNSGCNVAGYIYWSFIDNFEWQRGYTEKFGLYHVNITSPTKERIAKKSAEYYRRVIKSREILDKESMPC